MVRNDGNVHSTVQLTAQDPAGKLQFFGDEQPLQLEPGGTGTTAYRITHRRKRPLFGRVRQIPFEIEIHVQAMACNKTRWAIWKCVHASPPGFCRSVQLLIGIIAHCRGAKFRSGGS